MRESIRNCVLMGLLLFALSTAAWAQNTASISGAVKDQSGAVLPGVEVTAIQTVGKIRSTGTAGTNEPRIMQFALKYVF